MFDIYSLKGLLTFTEPLQRNPVSLWFCSTQQHNSLSITHQWHTSHISMQTWETHTHTQYTCGKSHFPSNLGPHLTQGQRNWLKSMELFFHAEGNLIHTAWREHTRRAAPSNTPTLEPSVNVRPWGRGFILERCGIFTPSLLPRTSAAHTEIHSHTNAACFNTSLFN